MAASWNGRRAVPVHPQPFANRRAAVVPLSHAQSLDFRHAGTKAATLARLLREGLPVPDGFVVTVDTARQFYSDNGLGRESLAAAFSEARFPPQLTDFINTTAPGPWAVRSSAICENLPWMSYAGLYRTLLDVVGRNALSDALRQCWAVITSPALRTYRTSHADDQPELSLALLVQRQLITRVAGVACSRDPLTGTDMVVLSALRGVSAPLLEGSCEGEVWIVATEATCQSSLGVLSAPEALAVGALARRVAAHFETPQEIEWAFEGNELHLLQARPLTCAPANTVWEAPLPGAWLRNVRLGEWLGAPLTPLAASWLLPALERGSSAFRRQWAGLSIPEPSSILVQGWYYATVEYVPREPGAALATLARMLLHIARHPLRGTIVLMGRGSDPATRLCMREWSEIHAPRQKQLVQDGTERLARLNGQQLHDLLDALVTCASNGFGLATAICGAAWKSELLLAEFCRRHLAHELEDAPQRLLCGLVPPSSTQHAVFSLDWSEKTSGERGLQTDESALNARSARASREAEEARAQVLTALAGRASIRKHFERLLNRAIGFSVQRSRCIREVTEGWPLMRRALLALGTICVENGCFDRAEDIFFLDKAELDACVEGRSLEMRAAIAARRRKHRLQRRLSAPLQLGDLPAPFRRALQIADTLRQPAPSPVAGERLVGLPASPGTASGCVRIARTPEDIAQLRDGEVAVVPLLVPAWVPMMARAAAVLADTGNHLAHGCVLAREIGLPCVLGLGNATARLLPGEWVCVDGASGTVQRAV